MSVRSSIKSNATRLPESMIQGWAAGLVQLMCTLPCSASYILVSVSYPEAQASCGLRFRPVAGRQVPQPPGVTNVFIRSRSRFPASTQALLQSVDLYIEMKVSAVATLALAALVGTAAAAETTMLRGTEVSSRDQCVRYGS